MTAAVQANPAGRDGIERCVYRAALAVDRLKLDLLGPKERNIGDEEVSTKPMPKSCHRFSQTSSSLIGFSWNLDVLWHPKRPVGTSRLHRRRRV